MRLAESTIFEAVDTDRIDTENGVIRGVKVLGAQSKNGRVYSPQALQDAADLYEGIGVKLNHPSRKDPHGERAVQESFGELRNCQVRGSGVYADHHFPVEQEFSRTYCESARRFPRQIGFSHNADGDVKTKNGKQVVESLASVFSVDLVDRPATNKSLFESEQKTMRITLREILKRRPERGTKRAHKLLREQAEAGMLPPDLEVDVPAEEVEGEEEAVDTDAAVKAAFRDAVLAVFDDESISADDTISRIGELVKSHASVSSAGEELPPEDELDLEEPSEEEEEEAAMESVTTRLRAVGRLIERQGRVATMDQQLALIRLSETDRKALIEALPRRNQSRGSSPGVKLFESESKDYDNRWDEALKAK